MDTPHSTATTQLTGASINLQQIERGALAATKWENPLIEVTHDNSVGVLSVASFTKLLIPVEVIIPLYCYFIPGHS